MRFFSRAKIGTNIRLGVEVPGAGNCRHRCVAHRVWDHIRALLGLLLAACFTPRQIVDRSKGAERQLEGGSRTPNPTVLQNDPRISGASRRICGGQSAETTNEFSRINQPDYGKQENGTGVLNVPSKILKPNHYFATEYSLDKEATAVTISVESDIPVKSYIVRPKALEYFREGGKNFKYYGGFPDPRMHQNQTVWLPFSGPWHLIISNPSKNETAELTYEVEF